MAESSGILNKFSGRRTKYGAFSASADTRVRETQMHNVRTGDTLIGLSVRYGVSVEDIKKLNNLWNNEGLFLRTQIRIPLPDRLSPTEELIPVSADSNTTTHNISSSISAHSDLSSLAAAAAPAGATSSRRKSVGVAPSNTDTSDMKADDFLSRFDMQLLKIKSSVEKLENKSSLSEEDNPLSLLPGPRTAKYLPRRAHHRQQIDRFVGEEDILSSPELQFRGSGSETATTSSKTILLNKSKSKRPNGSAISKRQAQHTEQEFYDL